MLELWHSTRELKAWYYSHKVFWLCSTSPVAGQLDRHLYESIRTSLMGLYCIFSKVVKNSNFQIHVLDHSVMVEMREISAQWHISWVFFEYMPVIQGDAGLSNINSLAIGLSYLVYNHIWSPLSVFCVFSMWKLSYCSGCPHTMLTHIVFYFSSHWVSIETLLQLKSALTCPYAVWPPQCPVWCQVWCWRGVSVAWAVGPWELASQVAFPYFYP